MAGSHAKQPQLAAGTGAPLPFSANVTGPVRTSTIFHTWTPTHLILAQ